MDDLEIINKNNKNKNKKNNSSSKCQKYIFFRREKNIFPGKFYPKIIIIIIMEWIKKGYPWHLITLVGQI